MGFVQLTIWNLRNKVPKIEEPGVGLAVSLLLSLFLFLQFCCFLRGGFGAGGGCLSLIQVHFCFGGAPICLDSTCIVKFYLDIISNFLVQVVCVFGILWSTAFWGSFVVRFQAVVIQVHFFGGPPMCLDSTCIVKFYLDITSNFLVQVVGVFVILCSTAFWSSFILRFQAVVSAPCASRRCW